MAKVGRRVKVDQMSAAIRDILEEFDGYISGVVVEKAVHETAEETAKLVSSAAPAKSGAYRSSITSGYPQRKRKAYTETVYAEKPKYRLTHLLERGHATRNGGRTAAFPHWESGENGIAERLVSKIKEAL